MTTAREAPSTWRGTWAVRLLGLLILAALVYGAILLIGHHASLIGG